MLEQLSRREHPGVKRRTAKGFHIASVHIGQILSGPFFSEPMRVETVRVNGPEGREVEYCWLEVDAPIQPMQVREPEPPPYGGSPRR